MSQWNTLRRTLGPAYILRPLYRPCPGYRCDLVGRHYPRSYRLSFARHSSDQGNVTSTVALHSPNLHTDARESFIDHVSEGTDGTHDSSVQSTHTNAFSASLPLDGTIVFRECLGQTSSDFTQLVRIVNAAWGTHPTQQHLARTTSPSEPASLRHVLHVKNRSPPFKIAIDVYSFDDHHPIVKSRFVVTYAKEFIPTEIKLVDKLYKQRDGKNYALCQWSTFSSACFQRCVRGYLGCLDVHGNISGPLERSEVLLANEGTQIITLVDSVRSRGVSPGVIQTGDGDSDSLFSFYGQSATLPDGTLVIHHSYATCERFTQIMRMLNVFWSKWTELYLSNTGVNPSTSFLGSHRLIQICEIDDRPDTFVLTIYRLGDPEFIRKTSFHLFCEADGSDIQSKKIKRKSTLKISIKDWEHYIDKFWNPSRRKYRGFLNKRGKLESTYKTVDTFDQQSQDLQTAIVALRNSVRSKSLPSGHANVNNEPSTSTSDGFSNSSTTLDNPSGIQKLSSNIHYGFTASTPKGNALVKPQETGASFSLSDGTPVVLARSLKTGTKNVFMLIHKFWSDLQTRGLLPGANCPGLVVHSVSKSTIGVNVWDDISPDSFEVDTVIARTVLTVELHVSATQNDASTSCFECVATESRGTFAKLTSSIVPKLANHMGVVDSSGRLECSLTPTMHPLYEKWREFLMAQPETLRPHWLRPSNSISSTDPHSVCLPDNVLVCFCSKIDIHPGVLRSIQDFWEGFKSRGLIADTTNAGIIVLSTEPQKAQIHVWDCILPLTQHQRDSGYQRKGYRSFSRQSPESEKLSFDHQKTLDINSRTSWRSHLRRYLLPSLFAYLGRVDNSGDLLDRSAEAHPFSRKWEDYYATGSKKLWPTFLLRKAGLQPASSDPGRSLQDRECDEQEDGISMNHARYITAGHTSNTKTMATSEKETRGANTIPRLKYKPQKVGFTAESTTLDSSLSPNKADGHVRDHGSVSETSSYGQIVSTLRLAGTLKEISTMIDAEILKASGDSSQESVSIVGVDADVLNRVNPVFDATNDNVIDTELVGEVIEGFKVELQAREDGNQVFVHLLKKWKGELEERYPLMKRSNSPAIKRASLVDELLKPRAPPQPQEKLEKGESSPASGRPNLPTDHAAIDPHLAASLSLADHDDKLRQRRQDPWFKRKIGPASKPDKGQAPEISSSHVGVSREHRGFMGPRYVMGRDAPELAHSREVSSREHRGFAGPRYTVESNADNPDFEERARSDRQKPQSKRYPRRTRGVTARGEGGEDDFWTLAL